MRGHDCRYVHCGHVQGAADYVWQSPARERPAEHSKLFHSCKETLCHEIKTNMLFSITYAQSHLEPQPSASQFIARISSKNTASIKLFEKLGFEIVKVVQVFDEVEMRLVGDRWVAAQLEGRLGSFD